MVVLCPDCTELGGTDSWLGGGGYTVSELGVLMALPVSDILVVMQEQIILLQSI